MAARDAQAVINVSDNYYFSVCEAIIILLFCSVFIVFL